MKKCNKCEKFKPTECFGQRVNVKDGLQYTCKECRVIASIKYRQQNKEKILISSARYYQENKEKVKATHTEYRKKNEAKILAYNNKWRVTNAGRNSQRRSNRKQQFLHPEKFRAKDEWQRYAKKHNLVIPRGYEGHHWNYNYGTDITLLLRAKHQEVHTRLIYDSVTYCFRTKEGILLDTKRRHLEYIYPIGG